MKDLYILSIEYTDGCESECLATVNLGIFEEDKLSKAKLFFKNHPALRNYNACFETELFKVNELTERF